MSVSLDPGIGSGTTIVPAWRRFEGVPRAIHHPGLVSSKSKISTWFLEEIKRAAKTLELLSTNKLRLVSNVRRSVTWRSVKVFRWRLTKSNLAVSLGRAGEVAMRSLGMLRASRLVNAVLFISKFDTAYCFVEIISMSILFSGIKKIKSNSFTLVELLVVISIIGLLAGLAVPAIQGGLDKAKQQVDVSNIRQCGLIAFGYANDNDGNFSGTNTNSQTSTAYFSNLVSLGLLNSTKILAGNGFTAATSTGNITAANIAWSVNNPLNTSDDGNLPLFISKNFGTGQSFSNVSLAQATNGWKSKGIVVYRIGNSAEFIKSGSGGASAGSVTISGISNNLSTATISDK